MNRLLLVLLAGLLVLAVPPSAPAKRALRCLGKPATIVGSGQVRGTAHADVIVSGGSSDHVDGGRGNDRICTAGGDDSSKAAPAATGSTPAPETTK